MFERYPSDNDLFLQREDSVHEKRYWLKVTDACNNNCVFCLDADKRQQNRFEDFDTVAMKMRQAYHEGNQRLIISGGEASIHPRFLDIVQQGRDVGFCAIQTITNGRMFSYKRFADRAVSLGLSEVTFSIHGHTPELHDSQTRAEGSFLQAVRGIRNVLATGDCIVNIDVVVSRYNFRFLDAIIEKFTKLGIYEYDLLHVVPFGNAYLNRDSLFFEFEEAAEDIKRAFSLSKNERPPYHIWSNRFPPQYLEGNEALIQSPHKLYDEIYGRQEMFDRLCSGIEPTCFPQQCGRCFIRALCGKIQHHVACCADLSSIEHLSTTSIDDEFKDFLLDTDCLVSLRMPLTSAATDILKSGRRLRDLELECLDGTPGTLLNSLEIDPSCVTLKWRRLDASQLERVVEYNVGRNVFVLSDDVATTLLAHPHLIEAARGVEFQIPTYERRSDALGGYRNVAEICERHREVQVRNGPPCLFSQSKYDRRQWCHFDVIRDAPQLHWDKLVHRFIMDDYFVRSGRCLACLHSEDCDGLHINHVRSHGFRELNPVRKGQTS